VGWVRLIRERGTYICNETGFGLYMIDGYDGWLGLAWVSARRFLDWRLHCDAELRVTVWYF